MSAPSSTAADRSRGSPRPIRVVLGGADGRMGRLAAAALPGEPDLTLVGELRRGDDPQGILVAGQADVYLDFTVASAARLLAPLAARAGIAPVVGTSGLLDDDLQALARACAAGGVGGLVVPNFSLGAVLQMQGAERAARQLPCSGIAEAHHSAKRDSPSGTARATARRIAQAAGCPQPPIASERRDDVLALQTVTFSTAHETLLFSHTVADRRAYLPGLLLALRAVRGCEQLQIGLDALLD